MASSCMSLLRWPVAALDTTITSALSCSRAAEFLFAGHSFSHFYSQEKRREQWDYEIRRKWVFFHQQPLGDRDFAPPSGGIGARELSGWNRNVLAGAGAPVGDLCGLMVRHQDQSKKVASGHCP